MEPEAPPTRALRMVSCALELPNLLFQLFTQFLSHLAWDSVPLCVLAETAYRLAAEARQLLGVAFAQQGDQHCSLFQSKRRLRLPCTANVTAEEMGGFCSQLTGCFAD